MVPRLRGRMWFSAASVPLTNPRYVTSVTRRNSSGVILETGEKTVTMAAFTHTSIGPSSRSNAFAASNIASASDVSAGKIITGTPSCISSPLVCSSAAFSRAISPSQAPSCAKRVAIARPTPALAPVTITPLLRKSYGREGRSAWRLGSAGWSVPRRIGEHPTPGRFPRFPSRPSCAGSAISPNAAQRAAGAAARPVQSPFHSRLVHWRRASRRPGSCRAEA